MFILNLDEIKESINKNFINNTILNIDVKGGNLSNPHDIALNYENKKIYVTSMGDNTINILEP